MSILNDPLFKISQKRFLSNRNVIWNSITITEEEINKRFARVGGECICDVCGQTYSNHHVSEEVLSIYPNLILVELCNGVLGKL
jgi:hypothetical protein